MRYPKRKLVEGDYNPIIYFIVFFVFALGFVFQTAVVVVHLLQSGIQKGDVGGWLISFVAVSLLIWFIKKYRELRVKNGMLLMSNSFKLTDSIPLDQVTRIRPFVRNLFEISLADNRTFLFFINRDVFYNNVTKTYKDLAKLLEDDLRSID